MNKLYTDRERYRLLMQLSSYVDSIPNLPRCEQETRVAYDLGITRRTLLRWFMLGLPQRQCEYVDKYLASKVENDVRYLASLYTPTEEDSRVVKEETGYNCIKYRDHRGSLEDSMTTVVAFHSKKAFYNYMKKLCTTGCMAVDFDESKLSFKRYTYDERIKWDTWIVLYNDPVVPGELGVFGFTNGDPESLP